MDGNIRNMEKTDWKIFEWIRNWWKELCNKSKIDYKKINWTFKIKQMKVNITSRDFKFFMLGVFAMLIFVIIYDWDEFEKGFKDGYNAETQIEKID